MARLLIREPSGVFRAVEISKPAIIIGRSSEVDVVLPDQRISRRHARIWQQDGQYLITDLNSSNGLLVNDTEIKEVALAHQDVVKISDYELAFEDDDTIRTLQFFDTALSQSSTIVKPAAEVITPSGARTPSGQLQVDEVDILRKKARILALVYELAQALSGLVTLEEI